MVRAPCCEKMGLKKGPWTPEEDQILINYINLYGHGNWRALPKQAGLLRCGKSCRLRWTNYLRTDIKRGNFSEDEKETIIKLHELLGNRWSAIAARLPGRTDNEIKNVWHTHLKKRVKQNYNISHGGEEAQNLKFHTDMKLSNRLDCIQITSPPHCSSDTSSVITADNNNNNNRINDDLSRNLSEGDENFWLEVLSNDQYNSGMVNYPGYGGEGQVQFPLTMEPVYEISSNVHETMDFWYHVFTRGGELPDQ